jgi:hypothetical protein
VNICLQRSHQAPHTEGKRKETTLRYVGFDQIKGIRTYRFERTSVGEETETFAVTTDMALFTKHHIGIQEGPALCAQKLTADLEAQHQGTHELTNEDLKEVEGTMRNKRPRNRTPGMASS